MTNNGHMPVRQVYFLSYDYDGGGGDDKNMFESRVVVGHQLC
jgi:hypothetical protein